MVSSLAQTGQWVSARCCGAGAASLSAGAFSQVSKSKRGTCRTYVSRSLVVRLTDERSLPAASYSCSTLACPLHAVRHVL